MGDLFKRLDGFMTSDLVRKLGGLFCLIALVVLAAGFLIGAKSVLKTMKGPDVAVEATDEEGAAVDEDEDMDDDADEDEDEEE